jgi:transcriptional regulator with XRE-family HTH domain
MFYGSIVAQLRKEKGWTQSELAMISGLCQPNVSRIEAELMVPRLATMNKLATALNVTVETFSDPSRAHAPNKITMELLQTLTADCPHCVAKLAVLLSPTHVRTDPVSPDLKLDHSVPKYFKEQTYVQDAPDRSRSEGKGREIP